MESSKDNQEEVVLHLALEQELKLSLKMPEEEDLQEWNRRTQLHQHSNLKLMSSKEWWMMEWF